jgi:peptide/nickel transport system substrate-binding protein
VEVARDGKSYTFKLRKNVKFHDGTPFDAAAVKFTYDRIQEPLGAPGVARAFLGPYDGADVVDAHTVRVRLKQPYAPFLRMWGSRRWRRCRRRRCRRWARTSRASLSAPAPSW